MRKPDKRGERLLLSSILCLKNHEECNHLLRDLLSPDEYDKIVQRLTVAEMLSRGLTYNEISMKTKASTATISRVNKVLLYGAGGYNCVFERLIK